MPLCNKETRIEKVKNGKPEVVANGIGREGFKSDCGGQGSPRGQSLGKGDAKKYGYGIEERIKHAVADIPLGEGLFAVVVDDDWIILENLPGRFESGGHGESPAVGRAGKQQTQDAVKDITVKNMRERVLVRNGQGVAGAFDDAFSAHYVPAFADRRLTLCAQHNRLKAHDGNDNAGDSNSATRFPLHARSVAQIPRSVSPCYSG